MHDSLRMRCVQSVGHLYTQIEDLFDIQRLASNQVPESLSLQQLHGDESPAVSLVDLIDRADIGEVEGGRREGLPLEPFAGSGIFGQLFPQKLQRNMATQFEAFV